MEKLVMALGPVFTAGLAIQQLGEIIDPLLEKVVSNHKRVFLGLISLVAGLALAFGADLHALQLLGAFSQSTDKHTTLDAFVTGVIISGGTEGINSILKFLKYKKEETKREAAAKTPTDSQPANAAVVPVPSAAALEAMNRK